MNRAAIYARVSTEDQAREGYSLEAQLEMLRAYCEMEGLVVSKEFIDDGYSGRDTKRPAYQSMLDSMDEWDVMVVIKMDRIHRNSMNFMMMIDFLEKHKKKFVSSTESLDTESAMGRFVVDMIQRIAQLESEQIAERTYIGMRQKAESMDGIMGFTPPFGYGLSNGELTVNEDEFHTVQRMFWLYLEDNTMDEICYRMNRDGIRTRKGNIWNKQNLRNILHNPIYAGYMRWQELLIPHECKKAVTKEEFNEVQEKMVARVRDPNKRRVALIP